MIQKLKNVTVAGSGVLGYQIAFQCAFHGYKVTVYDISEEILDKARKRYEELSAAFKQDVGATDEQVQVAFDNLTYSSNLSEAVADADLLIEAVPESTAVKTTFYKELAKVAPAKTIFATNTSTFLPSQFAEYTGRPEKFLALHFANNIRTNNTAEIMGHAGSDKALFDLLMQFAKTIGMIALPLYKEHPAYILNSLLVPLLDAAVELWINDVASPEVIDKTWMAATGTPQGPFGIIDIVGINTMYSVQKLKTEKTQDPFQLEALRRFKEEFLDAGKLGVPTGEGFYTYPNPAYKDKDFLKP